MSAQQRSRLHGLERNRTKAAGHLRAEGGRADWIKPYERDLAREGERDSEHPASSFPGIQETFFRV